MTWPLKAINEVCEIRPPKKEVRSRLQSDNRVSFLPMEDLGVDQKYVEAKHERLLREVEGSYTYFADGDVLLAKITPCFENGKLGIARGLVNGVGFGSSEYVVFRPSAQLDAEYLYYFMRQESFRQAGMKTMIGAVGHKRISKDFTERFQIPLPSISQQRRVVAALDELTASVQKLEAIQSAKMASLSELKASILQRAFSNQLRFDLPTTFPETPGFVPKLSSTDLHAGVLALAYSKHAARNEQGSFLHVKAEKIAHMVEAIAGIDLGRRPVKDAAGPNDFPHLQRVEHRAERASFFSFKKTRGGYQFSKKNGFDRLVDQTRVMLGSGLSKVESVIDVMVPMDFRQAEIFATVYAAWNNLLLDGCRPSDEEIVRAAREDWHPDKLNIGRDRFFAAVEWIRKHDFVPRGDGKRVSDRAAK